MLIEFLDIASRNPKKSIGYFDKEITYENENITIGSLYGLTPSRFSENFLADTISLAKFNVKASPIKGTKEKEVEKVNLNIASEKVIKQNQCCS